MPTTKMKLLQIQQLYTYQRKAVNWQCTKPYSMLWVDCGLGKTIITLTSINHLIKTGHLKSILIVAPLRVVHSVWRQEADKWSHTQQLTFSAVVGSKDQRIQALRRRSDIYMTNYENLRWLSDHLNRLTRRNPELFPFDGLVWDEVTKCKNSASQRVRSIKPHLKHFKWRTGLTGGMVPNGYRDLHGQFLVVDGGERLGTSKTRFRQNYFQQQGFKDIPYKDTPENIQNTIKDITLQLEGHELPSIVYNPIKIPLPTKLREQYDQLEKEFFIQLGRHTIEAPSIVALQNKCLQFCNGAIYPNPGDPNWIDVHDLKLQVLEEIVEGSNGKPVLCAYRYRSDARRIMDRFKALDPINLSLCKTPKSLASAFERWQNYDCRLMIGHPASMGHGIDGLQVTCNTLVWFGLTYSLDEFVQFNARLRRNGQHHGVICNQLLIDNTLDLIPLRALKEKTNTDEALRDFLNDYRNNRLAR